MHTWLWMGVVAIEVVVVRQREEDDVSTTGESNHLHNCSLQLSWLAVPVAARADGRVLCQAQSGVAAPQVVFT